MAKGSRNTEYDALPGVSIDQDTFVVLASRLGRKAEPLPKRNPEDAAEEIQYFTPEAFERGEVIHRDDIWEDPTGKLDNVSRLLKLGAIARMDHPEAANAVNGLRYRTSQEEKVASDRGIRS